MDTRTKIIDAAQAARIAQEGAVAVSGYFDPLTAPLAERLAAYKQEGRPLLVLIQAASGTAGSYILPPRARAELVAGLRVVDYVCDAPGDIVPQHRLEDEHRAALQRLIRHVHARQKADSSPTSAPSQKVSARRASS